MPLKIIRNNITEMECDAIVNAANPLPTVGRGVDSRIYAEAGDELVAARKRLGRIKYGDCKATPAFGLKADIIIHAVSPLWEGGDKGEETILAKCYKKALLLAAKNNCKSIAFPLLSSGNLLFPKAVAMRIAISQISEFLVDNCMQVYLVVFDDASFELAEKLFGSVQSYIDENYVREVLAEEYPDTVKAGKLNCSGMLLSPKRSLEDLLDEAEETFSQSLIRLIDRKELKDPDVYKKANIDRKLFSKIKNNKEYKPSKATALALSFALELDLDETKDLIGRAGYALSHSSKADIIVEFFIVNNNYDLIELNEVLYAFGQPLIGN